MEVLGAGFGKNFDVEKVRYGKVLFAADADVDGLQINNLLFTAFNALFHDLVKEGRVYQTVPPLFEITVGTGAKAETIYITNEADLAPAVKKLDREKKTYKIERNKGLGEMEADSFYDTVLDPEKRTLRRITFDDLAKAEAALHLTMGDNSQERKDFMSDNFQTAIDSGLVEGFEEGTD